MKEKEFENRIKQLRGELLLSKSKEATQVDKTFCDLVLFPTFKNLPFDKFDRMCTWIKFNYTPFKEKFPIIPIFIEAKKQTIDKRYIPEPMTKEKNNTAAMRVNRRTKEDIEEIGDIVARIKSRLK